jgi:GDP-D-mannose dehydratase
MRNPVVQVIDESNNEIIYTLRINGTSFRPKVFKEGTYTVKVGELGTDKMKTLESVRSLSPDKTKKIRVRL